MIDALSRHAFWAELGLTLAHFLWQGAAIAMVLWVGLWLMRRRSAAGRHAVCGVAMLLMAACPAATLWYVRSHPLPLLQVAREQRSSTLAAPAEDGAVSATVDDVAELDAPTIEAESPAPTPSFDGEGLSERAEGRWLVTALSVGAAVWAVGVAVLALRLMAGWVGLRRLRGRRTEPLPPSIEPLVDRLLRAMGLGRSVHVFATRSADEPLAFGLLRPVVLMPVAMLADCPPEVLEAMIAHELAHVRRHDLWINLLQRVIEVLLFYHPAVRWVSGRMRAERELCCDDLAVRTTGSRARYAEALARLSQRRVSPAAPSLAAGLLGRKLTMIARIRRVLQIPSSQQQTRFWLAGPLSLALAGSLVLVARIHTVAAGPAETAPPPVVSEQVAPPSAETSDMGTATGPTGPGIVLAQASEAKVPASAASAEGSRPGGTARSRPSRLRALGYVGSERAAEPKVAGRRSRTHPGGLANLGGYGGLSRGYGARGPRVPSRRLWLRAGGFVSEVAVKMGQDVKKGQLLVEFDNEEAKLDLEIATVRLEGAKQDYERTKKVYEKKGASAQDLQRVQLDLRLAELEMKRCKLHVDRTRLVSPIDGTVDYLLSGLMEGKKLEAGTFVASVRPKTPAATQEVTSDRIPVPGVAPAPPGGASGKAGRATRRSRSRR